MKGTVLLPLLIQLLLTVSLVNSFHISHRVSCQRKKLCNGNLMCAYVCEKGSVEIDRWAVDALKYQRKLQLDDDFVFYEMPGTHNSAINEADGYGIEKYFISALQDGSNLDQGDDIGEGVCQHLSLADQLRMGIRHLEIDLWWDPIEHHVIVCHSPIPLYPVMNISRQAEARGIDLQWEPDKMSCVGTKRNFHDVLVEIRDWAIHPEHRDEIVTLYLDVKTPHMAAEKVTLINRDILTVFKDMVWQASDGSPVTHKVSELVQSGKRIIVENMREYFANPSEGDAVVFYPALWAGHQFSGNSMTEFPACAVEGDTAWYGQKQIRALDGSFTEAATRCGVQVVSGDYTNPDDMKMFVWSWDQAEPSVSTANGGCVAMLPSGRWATLDCSLELPYACLPTDDNGAGLRWNVDLNRTRAWTTDLPCPVGYSFAAPHNGFANSVLLNIAVGQTTWLNAPNPLR